jgi:GNAT superfamily N-acetyltransferase
MNIAYLADKPDYLAPVVAWVHGYWGHLPPPRTLEQVAERFRTHLNRDRAPLTLVALEGDTILGTASLFLQDMSTRLDLSPWLAAVYVTPEVRRRGIGAALVRAVEEQASALGYTRLYLFTPDQDHFYARLGWTPLERAEYRTQSVVIMTRELATGR